MDRARSQPRRTLPTGRDILTVSAILGIGLCSTSGQAHADAVVFAGGNAGAQYDSWMVSNQTNYFNQSDHEQGTSSATAGKSVATGTVSFPTTISDRNGGYIPVTYQAQASSGFTARATFGTLHAYATAGYEQ